MLNCKETQDSAVKICGSSSNAVFPTEVPTSLETSEFNTLLLCLTAGNCCFKYTAQMEKIKTINQKKKLI